jgi:phage-related protein
LRRFPDKVKRDIGYALHFAQSGTKHPSAKPLRGFGSGVFEVVEAYDGNTYRAVYVVRFREAVYVLHAFQKKSKSGIKTPQKDIELIRQRFAHAKKEHQQSTKVSHS